MGGTGVIDQFLTVFTRYIDGGFGLLRGEVGFIGKACGGTAVRGERRIQKNPGPRGPRQLSPLFLRAGQDDLPNRIIDLNKTIWCRLPLLRSSLGRVLDVYPAVLRPRRLVVPGCARLFLAPTDGLHLAGASPQHLQRFQHRLCAALAQCQVVLLAASFVGMPFEFDGQAGP